MPIEIRARTSALEEKIMAMLAKMDEKIDAKIEKWKQKWKKCMKKMGARNEEMTRK